MPVVWCLSCRHRRRGTGPQELHQQQDDTTHATASAQPAAATTATATARATATATATATARTRATARTVERYSTTTATTTTAAAGQTFAAAAATAAAAAPESQESGPASRPPSQREPCRGCGCESGGYGECGQCRQREALCRQCAAFWRLAVSAVDTRGVQWRALSTSFHCFRCFRCFHSCLPLADCLHCCWSVCRVAGVSGRGSPRASPWARWAWVCGRRQ